MRMELGQALTSCQDHRVLLPCCFPLEPGSVHAALEPARVTLVGCRPLAVSKPVHHKQACLQVVDPPGRPPARLIADPGCARVMAAAACWRGSMPYQG